MSKICPVAERECRAFECLRLKGCRHQINSQPDPTPQDVAAPTLEQLAKDAARYRWLRDSHCMEDLPQVYADDDCNTWLTGEELDVAIDAAMSIATPPCK